MPAEIAPPAMLPGRRVEITIGAQDGGLRLDRALQRQLPELSRTRLKHLILSGQAVSEGELLRDPAQHARAGARIVVTLPEPQDPSPAPQQIALDIRFEDEHLIVLDKPAGMVVHPAPGNPDGTLVNALLAHCGPSLSGIGGVRRPGIVHRLDKDTSGLLVAAKTEIAHRALSNDFAARRIERAYSAIVWGAPIPAAGEIVGNIGRSPQNRKKMAVVAEARGRSAVTRFRVERRFGTQGNWHAALVECRLLTGRTHQIRVHLAHIGHPLIGDPVYGTRAGRAVARSAPLGAAIAGFHRQALHARLLGFVHPVTSETLTFTSPMPADMAALLSNLELL